MKKAAKPRPYNFERLSKKGHSIVLAFRDDRQLHNIRSAAWRFAKVRSWRFRTWIDGRHRKGGNVGVKRTL